MIHSSLALGLRFLGMVRSPISWLKFSVFGQVFDLLVDLEEAFDHCIVIVTSLIGLALLHRFDLLVGYLRSTLPD